MAMPGRMKSRSVPTPFRMAPELATCSEMFLFLHRKEYRKCIKYRGYRQKDDAAGPSYAAILLSLSR